MRRPKPPRSSRSARWCRPPMRAAKEARPLTPSLMLEAACRAPSVEPCSQGGCKKARRAKLLKSRKEPLGPDCTDPRGDVQAESREFPPDSLADRILRVVLQELLDLFLAVLPALRFRLQVHQVLVPRTPLDAVVLGVLEFVRGGVREPLGPSRHQDGPGSLTDFVGESA